MLSFKHRMWLLGCLVILGLIVGSAANADEYVLGPGDTIQASIWTGQAEQYTLVVGPMGQLVLPLIGEVQAAGKTVSKLTQELLERYSVYIREPRVTISLLKIRQEVVQVLGDVRTPGAYPMPPGATVVDCILRAGGPNEFADLASVSIQRRDGSRPVIVDLSAMLSAEFQSEVTMGDGDIIFVPTGSLTVAVIGEVGRPGVYRIRKGGRLIDAIGAAGGPTSKATLSRVAIYRGEDFEKQPESAKPVFKGKMWANPPLSQACIVYVPHSYFWDLGIVTDILYGMSILKTLLGL